MQSPEKLQTRLSELLGPPGPDVEPLELGLRTVVEFTAPMIQGLIDQHPPEALDGMLEQVAVWFLRVRSDDATLSAQFLEELGRINAEAVAHHHQGAVAAAPAAPALESGPLEPGPALQPAQAPAQTPAEAPAADPRRVDPSTPAEQSAAAPAPAEAPAAPAPTAEPAAPAPSSPSSGAAGPDTPRPSSPAPPWG